MKTFNLAFIIAIILLTNISCSTSLDNEPNDNSTATLKLHSIKTETYRNNVYTSHQSFNFQNNKLINKKYNNQISHEYLYNGDLVSNIMVYRSIDDLLFSVNYAYDNLGRLIYKKYTPNPNDVSHEHIIAYDDVDKTIQFDLNWTNGSSSNRKVILNNNGLIKRDILGNSHGDIIYTYNHNNLVEITHDGFHEQVTDKAKFVYLDKKVSEFYQYQKYIYGEHWKNNLMLNTQSGYGFSTDTHQFSDHYISSYDFIFHSPFQKYEIKGNFTYEFDNDDNIIKQIENKTITNLNSPNDIDVYKYIRTYTYE